MSVCQGHFAPWQPLFFLLTGPCHIESLEEGDTFGPAFHLSVCLSNHPSLFSPTKIQQTFALETAALVWANY